MSILLELTADDDIALIFPETDDDLPSIFRQCYGPSEAALTRPTLTLHWGFFALCPSEPK